MKGELTENWQEVCVPLYYTGLLLKINRFLKASDLTKSSRIFLYYKKEDPARRKYEKNTKNCGFTGNTPSFARFPNTSFWWIEHIAQLKMDKVGVLPVKYRSTSVKNTIWLHFSPIWFGFEKENKKVVEKCEILCCKVFECVVFNSALYRKNALV